MKIISQENDNLLKITVQNLENKTFIKDLLILLNTNKNIEINFLNLHTLPKEIIFKMNEIKERIKLFTNDIVLRTYLINLGFSLKYNDNYILQDKNISFEYIAIGGSAGSLCRFISIIKSLPKSKMSIFIIMHQKKDENSNLATLLQNKNKFYNVLEAKSDMKIQEATIYTAPAGKHLLVVGDFIFLSDENKRNYSKPSISTSFESLSNEYKSSLLLILISGYGKDGSDVLKKVHENKSTIIIQDPKECKEKHILQNAISTGYYNKILSLDNINSYIQQNYKKSYIQENDFERLIDKIYFTYGYDYRDYKQSHLYRRIELFYSTLQTKNFQEFEKLILENEKIFKDLFLKISVNVTTFYRNPELFKKLKKDILPKLDSFLDIKIWCAGCSSGEEVYSLAIFLKELGLLDKSLIYASDLNEIILDNAKNALYSKKSYENFLKNYYQAGGDESFSQYFNMYEDFVQIKDEIKEKVFYFKHNLVIDSKINDFQLIFCRNVLIYFNPKLKDRVFDLFENSLDSSGFLVLGESESLNTNNNYINIDKKNKIYKRQL